jgi:hypothetical protein
MGRQRRAVESVLVRDLNGRSEVGLLVRSGQYLPRRTRDFLSLLDPLFVEWLRERDERLSKSNVESLEAELDGPANTPPKKAARRG